MVVTSLHELTIVHKTTGERRTLPCLEVYAREITLKWPLWGAIRFHCRSGHGIGKVSGWRIEPSSLQRLHEAVGIKEVTFGPGTEQEDGQRRIKGS